MSSSVSNSQQPNHELFFPTEMLWNIFPFLSSQDKSTFALVDKRWHSIAVDQRMTGLLKLAVEKDFRNTMTTIYHKGRSWSPRVCEIACHLALEKFFNLEVAKLKEHEKKAKWGQCHFKYESRYGLARYNAINAYTLYHGYHDYRLAKYNDISRECNTEELFSLEDSDNQITFERKSATDYFYEITVDSVSDVYRLAENFFNKKLPINKRRCFSGIFLYGAEKINLPPVFGSFFMPTFSRRTESVEDELFVSMEKDLSKEWYRSTPLLTKICICIAELKLQEGQICHTKELSSNTPEGYFKHSYRLFVPNKVDTDMVLNRLTKIREPQGT